MNWIFFSVVARRCSFGGLCGRFIRIKLKMCHFDSEWVFSFDFPSAPRNCLRMSYVMCILLNLYTILYFFGNLAWDAKLILCLVCSFSFSLYIIANKMKQWKSYPRFATWLGRVKVRESIYLLYILWLPLLLTVKMENRRAQKINLNK